MCTEKRRRGHHRLADVLATQRCGQRSTAQRVTDPVRHLPALFAHERANGWQVIACVVGDTVLAVVVVTLGQAVTAHFRNPDVEPQAGQVSAQPQALGRKPEPAIGKAAVQQDHRHTTGGRLIGHAKACHSQFDGEVGAVTGFQAIHIFAQIAAPFGADQGDRK
ncbi:hypothetical protein D3C87_1157970 [compost metagenome]